MKRTKPFDKYPFCGEELVEKEVEKLLRGGVNTAIIKVKANVCLHCGESAYIRRKQLNSLRRLEEN